MNRSNLPAWSAMLMVALFLPRIASAQAGFEPQPLPPDGHITQPGSYYLERDLVVEQAPGIRVEADDVTLDLRGHAVRYAGTPQPGVFGVVAADKKNLHITNGAIGGFWFGVHCTQNQGLRVDAMSFDDIPYLAMNVAQSKDVMIDGCTFTNFRYDIPKEKDTYVIGINIGAEDVVISGNSFDAEYTGPDPQQVGMETVFVLFSANVSKRCVVTLNDMSANAVLPRSYGVWVASNAQVSASYNRIRNMKYGICLATDASAVAGFNRFVAEPPPAGTSPVESTGIAAGAAKVVHAVSNEFEGVSIQTTLPEDHRGASATE